MPLKLRRSLVGGICGGAAVLCTIDVAAYVSGSGSGADLGRITGVILTRRDDVAGLIAGCAVQFTIAVIAALGYAIIFEWVTRRAGALVGLAVGVAHAGAAGIAVGFLPVAGMIADGILPPGAFYEYRGAWMALAFVAAHVLFGVIVGAVYGDVLHRDVHPDRRWREIALTGRRPPPAGPARSSG